MIDDLTLIHHINGVAFDVSHLVQSVKLSGRSGASSRTLTATLLDYNDTPFQFAAGVNIHLMEGDFCILKYKDAELFRGMWFKTDRGDSRMMTATAYDIGVYLANNKDTFVYSSTTADAVFRDVCTRFGLPTGDVAETRYTIDELVESKATGWDVIEEALEMTYEATGIRYAVVARDGKLHLIERRLHLTQWVIETGVNLRSYSRSVSIEKVRTRIKIFGKEDTVLVEVKNSELESKIGILQDVETAKDEEMEAAQINEMAQTLLKEGASPERSMSITGTGIPDVIAGTGVYVKINEMDRFEQACYVQEDTHTWTKDDYEMSLKVIPADDMDIPEVDEEVQEQPTEMAVGNIVNFSGGPHYVSSVATKQTGKNRKAGQAKLTKIAKGARHPYHLIGGYYDKSVPGDCNVYGWVDENTVS